MECFMSFAIGVITAIFLIAWTVVPNISDADLLRLCMDKGIARSECVIPKPIHNNSKRLRTKNKE